MDCQAQGYECHDDGAGDATCVDTSQSCTDGEFRCEDNTAYNCIDGHMGIEPCGTASTCHEESDAAHCEESSEECGGHGHVHDDECECDGGYEVDPQDALNCVASVSFPQLACDQFQEGTVEQRQVVTVFGDVFTADSHAELDVPVEVTLPDNATSYIHFPVEETGTYVLFFDTTGAFETVLHRGDKTTGTEISPAPSGGTANGMCETVLTEHWHADLTYDGDDSGPVPYVIEFKPTSSQTVEVHHQAPRRGRRPFGSRVRVLPSGWGPRPEGVETMQHARHSRFSSRLGLSLAAAAALLVGFAACTEETAGESIEFETGIVGASSSGGSVTSFTNARGWNVELTTAKVAMGPVYFYSAAPLSELDRSGARHPCRPRLSCPRTIRSRHGLG